MAGGGIVDPKSRVVGGMESDKAIKLIIVSSGRKCASNIVTTKENLGHTGEHQLSERRGLFRNVLVIDLIFN